MQGTNDKIVFSVMPDDMPAPEAANAPDGEAKQERKEETPTQASPRSEAELAHEAAVHRLAAELEARAARRRRFGLEGLSGRDDEEEDLGPGLAGWLAAHRDRQRLEAQAPPSLISLARRGAASKAPLQVEHADASPEADPPEEPDEPLAPTGTDAEAPPEADSRWGGKAKLALDEMLEELPGETCRLWDYDAGQPTPRRGGRLALTACGAALLTGVAAVALYAAAHDNGIDLAEIRIVPDEPAIAGPTQTGADTGEAPQPGAAAIPSKTAQAAPVNLPAPTVSAPVIEIEPTRIVSASLAAVDRLAPQRASAPSDSAGGTTLLLPGLTDAAGSAAPLATMDRPEATPAETSLRAPPPVPFAAPARSAPAVRIAATGPAAPALAAQRAAAPSTPAPQPPVPDPAIEDPDLDRLIARAEELLRQGDIVAARLLFERAARKGDAAAALGAGSTYDPLTFVRLGVRGVAPDPERALFWYRAARQAGSPAAGTEIAQLEAWMKR